MHFNICLNFETEKKFLDHWESKYSYKLEPSYDNNIGQPLTSERIDILYEWKNGGNLSAKKRQSVLTNYPTDPPSNFQSRYLCAKQSGGAIWNIFYLHILDSSQWPIFDQHAYRSMKYLTEGKITEIPSKKSKVYESYLDEYIPFLNNFEETDKRRIDKALFSFGRFLKILNKYK